MGRTGVDFSAVSTAGLITRVKRRADTEKTAIDQAPFTRWSVKQRKKAAIDYKLQEIDMEYVKVLAGQSSEDELRAALIAILDPGLHKGLRRTRLGW